MEHKARPPASSISFPSPKNTTIHPLEYAKTRFCCCIPGEGGCYLFFSKGGIAMVLPEQLPIMKPGMNVLILAVFLAALSATAQVPGIISHQGKVTVGGTNYTGTGHRLPATDGSRMGEGSPGRVERKTVSVGRHHLAETGQLLRKYRHLLRFGAE